MTSLARPGRHAQEGQGKGEFVAGGVCQRRALERGGQVLFIRGRRGRYFCVRTHWESHRRGRG
eukprot:10292757-Lingulodinium_polyedra.AAC.1